MPVACAEYVWCSGKDTYHDLRSKVKTLNFSEEELKAAVANPAEVFKSMSEWNFDGSSTKQAAGKDTEIIVKPVASWAHPFITDIPAFVVLAECFFPNGEPTPDNTRCIARSVFEHQAAAGQAPWFGLEQEYVLYKDARPLGWPADGTEPAPQGPYYCSNGANVAHGRNLAQKHYTTCLKMGLKLSGTNAEVMPGQWEYQIGPCESIESGDHTLMSRWAYVRLCEEFGVEVNFESKPKKGDWNGSGLHCNFSTEAMRAPNGIDVIHSSIKNLATDPFRDVAAYGADNIERLSGEHETSRLDVFNYDVGTRHTSCRIPNAVTAAKCGYFEDRRPSSSADPYLVTSRLFASACQIPAEKLDALCDSRLPQWLLDMRNKKA
jgi:glutamine synthetase